jgi:RNA polymerase sigma factor (sigma-70 family)
LIEEGICGDLLTDIGMDRLETCTDQHPTRSSLVQRLKDWDDQEGWREFFDLYWKLLYCVAIKAGLTDAEGRDVVQETVVAVATNLREGRYEWRRGSFRSWLLTILYRKISNHVRKHRKEAHATSTESNRATPLLERLPANQDEIEQIWNDEWAKNLADAAIEAVKKKVNPKLFQTFDLYVLKEWPVSDVARVMRIAVAQVYIAKYRVTAQIRREAQRLERKANALFEKPRDSDQE